MRIQWNEYPKVRPVQQSSEQWVDLIVKCGYDKPWRMTYSFSKGKFSGGDAIITHWAHREKQ